MTEDQMRAQTRSYVMAVIEAHPEFAVLMPDEEGPPEFDPYPTPMTFTQITKYVCQKRGFTSSQIRGKALGKDIVRARQECFYLARMTRRYTYQQIARYYGGRDHSTVMHGTRVHAERHGLSLPEDIKEAA